MSVLQRKSYGFFRVARFSAERYTTAVSIFSAGQGTFVNKFLILVSLIKSSMAFYIGICFTLWFIDNSRTSGIRQYLNFLRMDYWQVLMPTISIISSHHRTIALVAKFELSVFRSSSIISRKDALKSYRIMAGRNSLRIWKMTPSMNSIWCFSIFLWTL